ncbi:universal stress protein [Portibacter lacus]|uniref:UspA domain-containing protein n=1 Tax=Portibacter lacus TaxID=1099794 RepID=A0AA37SMK0_9BACT|nr:universal stress protein [Portibacter lacus]GLR17191.1 hypothetical protein GCM10007940_18060 [Portibacter lacus]
MTAVKIYGAETSRYEYFKFNLDEFIKKHDLNIMIEEIKDINKIIEENVQSIPTLRINSHVDIVYNDEKGIDQFISEAKKEIVHEFAPGLLTSILIPVDFSEMSLNALNYGMDLSKKIGSEIELLHVNHPSPMVVEGAVILDKISSENQKYNLQRIVDNHKMDLDMRRNEHELVLFKTTYLEGFAGDEIIRISKEKDLIIMGATGENLTKKLLGSVSLKVLKKAHCPVIFVQENQKFKGFEKIVYAYSPTAYDQKAIKEVVELASKYNSEVHLVHVDDGSDFTSFDIESYVAHMYEGLEFIYKEIKDESVSSGITKYAEQIDADLIILSKKKKNLLQKIIDVSQSKATVLKATTPVMVLHESDRGCLCGGACKRKPEDSCNH